MVGSKNAELLIWRDTESEMQLNFSPRGLAAMRSYLILTALALMLPLQPAIAQDRDDIRVRVGLGGQIRPEYIGAEGSDWAPLWDLAIKRGIEPFEFEAPDDNFDIKLISKNGFAIGPVASIQNGREESEVGAPVGKVPTTFEVGAFAEYHVSDSIRLRGELRKGIGGHEGLIASIGGDHVWRDGDRYVLSVGPRLLVSDARYQREWFGVSTEASAASGLAPYRPGGGLHAIASTSGLTYQFSRKWGVFGFARYERLISDASRSPIVRDLGSKDQLSAGGGLTYTFTVRR